MPGAAILCLLAAAAAPLQAAQPTRLLYAEPLAAVWESEARSLESDERGVARGRLRFRAYGRTFDLDLRPNPRLAQAPGRYLVQTGTLASVPGSWARITRRGEDIIGILSDGEELFGIEPGARLAAFIDPTTPLPGGHNLIYRLSDLRVDAALLTCGLARPGGTLSAAAAVAAVTKEFAAPRMAAAAAGPLRRIALAPVADVNFASRYGVNAESEIMARLNVVDGIFREQVGIDIAVGTPEIFRSEAEPYPFKSTTANVLLNQVSDYRVQSGQYQDFGLTHLFTEKRLEGDLAGIAWLGAACSRREGAALSSSYRLTATLNALVAAHEIGHNFNAPHDGEAGSPCESTPTTYLMAPRVASGQTASTFSACSLERMHALIDRLSCLTTLANYDVSLLAPTAVQGSPGEATDVALTVQNLGEQEATAVSLEIVLPAALTVTASEAGPGSCAAQADGLLCALDRLGVAESWPVDVTVRGDEAQRYTVTARVLLAADENPANDAAQFSVTIGSPELAVADGGGGGGGAPGPIVLAALGFAALRRRGRRCG